MRQPGQRVVASRAVSARAHSRRSTHGQEQRYLEDWHGGRGGGGYDCQKQTEILKYKAIEKS